MSVLAVARRVLVQVEALLERRSGEASVVLLSVLRTNSGPVNYRLDQALLHFSIFLMAADRHFAIGYRLLSSCSFFR